MPISEIERHRAEKVLSEYCAPASDIGDLLPIVDSEPIFYGQVYLTA